MFRKIIQKISIICLAVIITGLFLVYPQKTHAVEPTIIQPTVGSPIPGLLPIPLPIQDIGRNINQSIGGAIIAGLFSGLGYTLNKLAYEMSTWLVSGDYDHRPLFLTQNAGEYFKNLGLDAVGEVLGYISDNSTFLKKYKVNLCTPPDIRLQLWLKLAVFDTVEPKPRCSWQNISDAYKRMATPGYWQNVGVGFTAGQNDLSVFNQIYGFTKEESLRKEVGAAQQMQFGGEATCPKNPVTGECTTPKEIVKQTEQAQAPSEFAKDMKQSVSDFTNGLSMGNLSAVFVNATKLFVNNLAAESIKKLVQLGFISIFGNGQQSLENLQLGSLENVYASGGGTRAAAEQAFAEFLTPTLMSVDSYNYVAEMADCGDEKSRGYLTCVIDAGLQSALAQAEAGVPLTVKEAVDKNFLHPDWVLYGPDFTDKNSQFNCALDGYCYTNLVKLRLWRVLPVGFELAAKLSTPDHRVTLRNALAHFNDVNNSSGLQHLIDPDWVIKAPVTRCGALTYGSIYLTGMSQRAQYCADPQSCVKEDQNGQCINDTSDASWGYCLREKNVWRLGGDSCDAQYNTCTAYTNSQGSKVAYLASTLDKGFCSAQNTGCRAYSQVRDVSLAGWQPYKSIFLNSKAEQCVSTNEGCSKFIKTDGSEVTLKKAPSTPGALPGYNCYGEKNGQTGWGEPLAGGAGAWPVNKADLYKIFSTWSEKQKTECGRFAGVCAAEEVGCERYTPDNGNPPIPGILSANDVCPAECAGYETYIEQPTVFSATAVTASFIPATAQACESNYVGCDEFVNLENQAGEAKQYFSELRACSKTESEGATFYTWEGSDTAGYQLKSYTLKTTDGFYGSTLFTDSLGASRYLDDTEADPEQSSAPPAYNTTNPAKLAEYAQKCNRDIYKHRSDSGVSLDPDCREFYDKGGKKSYRLYSKTITIDAARCQKFRKGESTETSCTETGGSWDPQGFCIYLAIPDEGRSCPAEANGCRAYKGNAGNNFQVVGTETYENGRPGQSDGHGNQYSAESLSLNGVSLKVNSGTYSSGATGDLPEGSTYLISFWVKGNLGNLTATVFPSNPDGTPKTLTGITPPQQIVKINTEWAAYTVGPFNISWDQSQASTTFKLTTTSGAFFIDNLVLKKMTDNIYIIKNSWNTPASCDNPLDDPYGAAQGGTAGNPLRLLPQAQLGCANYQNSKFDTVTVKSFTSMCREEAVGCEKLVDTYNNAATSTYYYNVVCRAYNAVASPNRGNISNQPMPCKDKQGVERCQIAPNQSICLFNTAYSGIVGSQSHLLEDLTGGATTDIDGNNYTISIQTEVGTFSLPADREIYLVNDQAHQCAAENVGCQASGLIDYDKNGFATSTQTAYLKNSPDKYNDILCSQDAEGCGSYTTAQGGLAYFRDPVVWGNKLCEWQENKLSNTGSSYTGWFLKGTNQGCYWSTLNTGGSPDDYKVKSVGSSGYENKVGICPVEQDTCSEFVDPLSTSSLHPEGEPYFVLNNQKLDKASCQGQASLKKGCVLFNQTSQGTKLWNTTSTYAASQAKNDELVAPIDCGRKGEKGPADNPQCKDDASDANNANIVLKVIRDRVCGEWLACKSSYSVWDDKLGKYKKVCTEIGRCNQAPAADSGEGCANWIDGIHQYAGKILTAPTDPSQPVSLTNIPLYQSRQTGWAGMDFSGFSKPDWLPLEELSMMNTNPGQSTAPDWRLGKKISLNDISHWITTEAQCVAVGGHVVTIVGASTCLGYSYNQTACTAIGGFWFPGGQICVETPKGTLKPEDAPSITCRGYPEAGAPLPNEQSLFDTQPINVSNTNLCSESVGEWKNLSNPFMIPERPNGIATSTLVANACDCNYTKAEYEGKVLFWRYDNPNKDGSIVDKRARSLTQAPRGVLPGICIDGPYIGMACSSAADCSKPKTEEGAQGTCAPLTKASRLLGWQGVCLEEDTSQTLYGEKGRHPCLAWLPVDQTPGMYDVFNQHKEAGFDPQSSQYSFIDGPYYCTNAARWENRPGYQINNIQGYLDCDGGTLTDGQIDSTNADPVYAPPLNEVNTPLAPYFYYYDEAHDLVNIQVFRKCQGIGATDCTNETKTHILTPPQKICSNHYTAFNLRQFTRESISCGEEEDKFTMSFDCKPYQSALALPAPKVNVSGYLPSPPDDSKQTGWTGWFYDPTGTLNEDYQVPDLLQTPIYDRFSTSYAGHNWANAGQHFPSQNESQEWRCTEMYKVGDNGSNKANTELIWEEDKKIFSGNKNCDPVGALALYTTPPDKGAAIVSTASAPEGCLKGKITDDPNLPETDGAFYQGGVQMQLSGNNADNDILRYFVKGYKHYVAGNNAAVPYLPPNNTPQLNLDLGYRPIASGGLNGQGGWDTSETYGGANAYLTAPKMAAVGTCLQTDNCQEGSSPGMTVNSQPSGDVLTTTPGFGSAILRFYAWADNSHMPLRSVVVDWGDGERIGDGVVGYYRNHRGLDNNNNPKCKSEDQAGTFDYILGKTCDSTPFNFSHAYSCLGPNSVSSGPGCDSNGDPLSGRISCWIAPNTTIGGTAYPKGACVFKPRVHLQDNWGWCNGTCPGGVGGQGCYDASVENSGECDLSTSGPWTAFAGKVIVIPR